MPTLFDDYLFVDDLAKDLLESAYAMSRMHYQVNGLDIENPFDLDYGHYQEYYEAEAFLTNVLPNSEDYLSFIELVANLKQVNGNIIPADIISGMYLFQYANSEYKENDELPKLSAVGGYIEIVDVENIERVFSKLINSNLRDSFANFLSKLIPQNSPNSEYERGLMKKGLEKLGIDFSDGVILNLGCGTGHSMNQWKKLFPEMNYVGMDWQYIDKWFSPFWKGASVHTVADIDALPLGVEFTKLVILEYVVQYLSEEKLSSVLQEVYRVLEEDGICAINPYNFGWCFFKKANGLLIKL